MGTARSGTVRRGMAVLVSYGLIRKAWYCEVWYGQARQGKAVVERRGKIGRGEAVEAVQVRYGQSRQGKAVMVGHVSVRYVWARRGLARRSRRGTVWKVAVCLGGSGTVG